MNKLIKQSGRIIILVMILALSCNKEEEEKVNQNPSCYIILPTNYQKITQGDTVTISVEAKDPDGTIKEVQIFIDGIEKESVNNYPYNYIWNTSNESTLEHTIKANAIDNLGGNKSSEIIIAIAQGGGSSLNIFIDPRDDHTYKTVEIGNQTWFAENLNYETNDSWCYDNNGHNCDAFGRLYTRASALTSCPNGWHLPSDDDWKILEMNLGMSQTEADQTGCRGIDDVNKLKSTIGWLNNGNGTDEVGFWALPAGYRESDEDYRYMGNSTYWWTSTEGHSYSFNWNRVLYYYNDNVSRYDNYYKNYGFSVRCVKN